MPIYAYRCEACGFAKDVLQKVSDAVLTECPSCGQSAFKKQLTAAGFQLKGTGWYVTDFRNNSSANSGGASTNSGGASAKSGGASTNSEGASTKSGSDSASTSASSDKSADSSGTAGACPASCG